MNKVIVLRIRLGAAHRTDCRGAVAPAVWRLLPGSREEGRSHGAESHQGPRRSLKAALLQKIHLPKGCVETNMECNPTRGFPKLSQR